MWHYHSLPWNYYLLQEPLEIYPFSWPKWHYIITILPLSWDSILLWYADWYFKQNFSPRISLVTMHGNGCGNAVLRSSFKERITLAVSRQSFALSSTRIYFVFRDSYIKIMLAWAAHIRWLIEVEKQKPCYFAPMRDFCDELYMLQISPISRLCWACITIHLFPLPELFLHHKYYVSKFPF